MFWWYVFHCLLCGSGTLHSIQLEADSAILSFTLFNINSLISSSSWTWSFQLRTDTYKRRELACPEWELSYVWGKLWRFFQLPFLSALVIISQPHAVSYVSCCLVRPSRWEMLSEIFYVKVCSYLKQYLYFCFKAAETGSGKTGVSCFNVHLNYEFRLVTWAVVIAIDNFAERSNYDSLTKS